MLRDVSFLFPDGVLKGLNLAGVSTAEELMIGEALEIVARSNGALTLENVLDARSKAASVFGGSSSNAFSLMLSEARSPHMCRATGQGDFDALFGGGLPSAKAVELIGPMGVGKTQLCMWLACRLVAQEAGSSVMFISSSNAISAERFESFLDFAPAESRAELMSRIEIHHCFDANQLMDAMYSVYDTLCEGSCGLRLQKRISAFIVDSIVPLLQPTIGKAPFGHSLMFSFRHVLYSCASVSRSAMVLTNFVTGQLEAEKDSLNWAMGPSWGHIPSVRVWMTPGEEGSDSCVVTVCSSGAGFFQKACSMHIGSKGLRFTPHEYSRAN